MLRARAKDKNGITGSDTIICSSRKPIAIVDARMSRTHNKDERPTNEGNSTQTKVIGILNIILVIFLINPWISLLRYVALVVIGIELGIIIFFCLPLFLFRLIQGKTVGESFRLARNLFYKILLLFNAIPF